MRILRIVLLIVGLALVVLLVGGFMIFQDMTQSPIPDVEGELTVAGLNDRVDILRDEWGVPHIYASNSHDLFFAQGYTHAQDRWWQMEFFRHTGSGTIQELTGQTDSVMGTDVFLRTLGFREIAQRELEETYSPEAVAILQAFADGVNAYIGDRSNGDLALEYSTLGITGVSIDIEPWTPVDTLIWGKVMALSLGGNYDNEELLSDLYANMDEDLINDWFVEWPYGEKPTIVWDSDLPITEENAPTAQNDMIGAGIVGINTEFAGNFTPSDLAALPIGYGEGIGSNNWVVSGALTESGMPLMANDMHLSIQMPSIWYEIGLHCQPVSDECPYNVDGFVFSPTPGVTAGHNDSISWAFTNVGPDTQDLYQIRVNPDNPLQYEWNGEWRDMEVRDETLNFGDGADPITFQVRMTHFGPIINDNQRDEDTGELLGFNNEDPLALRWTSFEPGTLLEGMLGLNRAQNWEEFRAALSLWDGPSQNVIYADIEGNIGYQTPGRLPIRAEGHTGLLPVPGWTDEYDWRGYIPFDYLPRIWNPERGYIASANQALVPLAYYDQLAEELDSQFGDDSDYTISRQWAYGYRGDRINTLVEELQPHTYETFQQIHGDNYDGSAAEILPFLSDIDMGDDALNDARDWLLTWDYQMHMDSAQAALYAEFWKSLVTNVFNDQFGDLTDTGGNNPEWWAMYLLMQDENNAWWDDINTSETETRDVMVARSFAEAHAATVEALGSNRDNWRWGALHGTTFVSNPLGASGISLVENIVNRGPVETSGTGNAINATAWNASRDDFATRSGPSERVVYDVGDWTRSMSMHTTGQSGHPYSDHYDDMIDSWRNIQYHPMLWTREQVEAAVVSTLTLLPQE